MEVVSKRTAWRTLDLLYCSAFATLMMVGANITSFVPFLVAGGVPITLQTFFGVLAGLVLGRVKGAVACTVYMCIGLAGAPVFAKFSGGLQHLYLLHSALLLALSFALILRAQLLSATNRERLM